MYAFIVIGDIDPSQLAVTEWITFAIGALIALIIMLNLLISIISDTFDRVQMTATIENSRAII